MPRLHVFVPQKSQIQNNSSSCNLHQHQQQQFLPTAATIRVGRMCLFCNTPCWILCSWCRISDSKTHCKQCDKVICKTCDDSAMPRPLVTARIGIHQTEKPGTTTNRVLVILMSSTLGPNRELLLGPMFVLCRRMAKKILV